MMDKMKELFNYSMITCERHQRWQQREQKLPLAMLRREKKLKTCEKMRRKETTHSSSAQSLKKINMANMEKAKDGRGK